MSKNPFLEASLAQHYEQWYEVGAGRRADVLEKELLSELLKRFSKVQSLVEIGCGTGHFTRYFAAFLPSVVGLDISPAMLQEARSRNTLRKSPYLMGDALHLPFADASFDVVAFITTLEFLKHPKQALKEAERVARQGLLLGVLNASSLMGIARRLEGLKQTTLFNQAHFYSVGELSRLVRKSLSHRKNKLFWRTTLFPQLLPFKRVALPFGGFIGMRVAFN
jgi:ubiquinone/menaquinone biosynthesis C-methylase UbiE